MFSENEEIGILQSYCTVLLANEGFNGSFSGSYENVNLVLEELIKLTASKDINVSNFLDLENNI